MIPHPPEIAARLQRLRELIAETKERRQDHSDRLLQDLHKVIAELHAIRPERQRQRLLDAFTEALGQPDAADGGRS